jgi:hypothetical protein
MIITSPPPDNYGFIYILSHPSMPNVFKVGLTTNSVAQRIRELNGTGLPKPFKAEKIFAVEMVHLRNVEQLAHKKLSVKDMHHGKEFFEGILSECVASVEDAIYEIAKISSTELVGQAKRRSDNARRVKEASEAAEAHQKDIVKQKIEQEEAVAEAERRLVLSHNETIDGLRRTFIKNREQEIKDKVSFFEKYVLSTIALIVFGFFTVVLVVDGEPVVIIVLVIFWLFVAKGVRSDKLSLEKSRHDEATKKYPYKTMDK